VSLDASGLLRKSEIFEETIKVQVGTAAPFLLFSSTSFWDSPRSTHRMLDIVVVH